MTRKEQSNWIPVKDRLPEDSGEYLVTVVDPNDRDYRRVGIAWFAHPNNFNIWHGEWLELMIDEEVIAWQEKPQPYDEWEYGITDS